MTTSSDASDDITKTGLSMIVPEKDNMGNNVAENHQMVTYL